MMPQLAWSDWVGIGASVLLFINLSAQVLRQHRDCVTEGVPAIFFILQLLASAGFIFYSAVIGSGVFVVTNTLVLASALAGYVVTLNNRRRVARLEAAGSHEAVSTPVSAADITGTDARANSTAAASQRSS